MGIAVASATKNKEMVAKEDKLRAAGKLKSYDGPIKKARKAPQYAGKMVENARAALAATLGTKARIAAKHALLRAQNAMHDANTILRMEMSKKNVITGNRSRVMELAWWVRTSCTTGAAKHSTVPIVCSSSSTRHSTM